MAASEKLCIVTEAVVLLPIAVARFPTSRSLYHSMAYLPAFIYKLQNTLNNSGLLIWKLPLNSSDSMLAFFQDLAVS